MPTHPAVAESSLSPEQSLLVDEIGNEVYASHYAERKLSRFVIGTETVLLLGAFGVIVSLAHRPIANRYIRIDEMGRAQAIQYSDLNYSPREGEIRTYLTDWANYRYTISRDTVGKKYPLNYYFLSQTCLGLRVSEIAALQWEDFDFDRNLLLVQRSFVNGRIDDVKTEYSQDHVPVHDSLLQECSTGAKIARPRKRVGSSRIQ